MLLTLLLLLPALSSAMAQEEEAAMMTINRFLSCQAVDDHEPTGVTDTFPAATEKVYAYLEATKISADVEVSFVWYHENREMARVPLTIRQGNRWRTYASKKVAGRTGGWRVDIQDATAAVLASLNFTVK
jgi:hypothetical protein